MTMGFLEYRRLRSVTWAISAIWLLTWAWYISANIGWAVLFALMPHELGAILAAGFAPLIFLWLVEEV